MLVIARRNNLDAAVAASPEQTCSDKPCVTKFKLLRCVELETRNHMHQSKNSKIERIRALASL